MTFPRYYAICLPLQAGLIWTKGKAALVCIISWILSGKEAFNPYNYSGCWFIVSIDPVNTCVYTCWITCWQTSWFVNTVSKTPALRKERFRECVKGLAASATLFIYLIFSYNTFSHTDIHTFIRWGSTLVSLLLLRFELGRAMQKADALITELRRTIRATPHPELRRTLRATPHPMSYAAP